MAAGAFAFLWQNQAALRRSALGGALAALFLLAEPAYTAGAALAGLARRQPGTAAGALFGAASGVLAAVLVLIPRLQPGVIFLVAAAVLLIVAVIETRRPSQSMNATNFSLNGKCAIVTGVGDRGQVGYALARGLADAGARVCVTGFSGGISELAAELDAVGMQADLTSEDDVARLVAMVQERFGRIDILVNVAGGLSVVKPIGDTTREEWDREIQRNAQTAFLVSRAALPALRESRGSIINFASPAGLRALPQLGAYSAAKAAVVAFTRALAIEEKTSGVRVNAIAPGMIDTEQNRSSVTDPSNVKWVTRDQVMHTVLFLASAAASGITGETIHVLGEGIE